MPNDARPLPTKHIVHVEGLDEDTAFMALPAELLDALGWRLGDELRVEARPGGGLVVTKEGADG